MHRWQRPGSAWPGHTTFVAIRAGEVVVGDRYASDGVERSYACEAPELLEGCFQALVAEQLGQGVLDELLAEVRHVLGMEAPAEAPPSVAPPSAAPPSAAPPSAVEGPASEPKPALVSMVVSAQTEPGRLDVTVVRCPSLSLPLAVALRGITRASVHELRQRLRSLPCRVLAGVLQAEAERARAQLLALGAAVELTPAA